MAEFPAFPLWTDAYLGDTTHLTTIEHGAFLLLLFAAWRTPTYDLPDDDKLLARYCRLTPSQWARIRPTIMGYWKLKDGRWFNGRLLDERDAVRRKVLQRSDAGKASALKRLHRSSTFVQRGANGASTSKATATATPKTTIEKETTTTASAVVVVGFDQFFKEMPRQWNRASAKVAYSKALTVVSEDTLLEAAKKYASQAGGFEDQYILPPAKWLADERWSDFVRATPSAFDSPEEKAFQQRMVEKYYGTS